MKSLQSRVRESATAVVLAGGALAANPVRTALGALATAVAVATIVIVGAALDGIAVFARQTSARAFGADTFLLAQVASPGRVTRRELEEQLRRNPPIARADVRFLERQAGGLVLYAPNAQARADVAAGARTFDGAAVTGTTAALVDLRELGISRGRFFTDDEAGRGAAVAVLGADLVEALFPGIDPLGRSVRIAGRRFDIVGVQDRLGTLGGASQDRYVFVPLVAFERAFGAPRSLQIFARASGGRPAEVGEDRARISMRARRALEPGEPDTFDLLTPQAARTFVQQLSERIGQAALPISMMALVAAVVVVANTVLVSVTQRTREIGVRRALGASRRQVMGEVLAESALTTIAGGAAGGLGATACVEALARLAALPVAVRPSSLAWALLASGAAGLLAGWYPARRAVALDPVAAMRSE